MKKVLMVEDNEDNALLFRTLLSLRDYELTEARTGLEGVQLAIENKPDLILMDIQLPDINGLEAIHKIRQEKGIKAIIVAITSYAMDGDKERFINAGCDGYIEKPIDPEAFLEQLDEMVRL